MLTDRVAMSDYRPKLEERWIQMHKARRPGPGETAPDLAQLEALMAVEKDPGKRAALWEKIKKARGES